MDPLSGKVIKRNKLDKKYFGEGIAVAGNIIYMLTWKEHELLLFDVDTLEVSLYVECRYVDAETAH